MIKEYNAIVEKTYRIFIIASMCLILYMSLAVSDEVQTIYPNIDVGFLGPVVAIILILFVVWLMVIRCKGRDYVMYSGENFDLKLDFEQTEISKIYYEFKHRGIMCC